MWGGLPLENFRHRGWRLNKRWENVWLMSVWGQCVVNWVTELIDGKRGNWGGIADGGWLWAQRVTSRVDSRRWSNLGLDRTLSESNLYYWGDYFENHSVLFGKRTEWYLTRLTREVWCIYKTPFGTVGLVDLRSEERRVVDWRNRRSELMVTEPATGSWEPLWS
jgi:hypothetical protein